MQKKNFQLGPKTIQEFGDVFIIAEAGVNHNGELNKALALIDAASDAGADAVKFQTFKAEQVTTKTAQMAAYQEKNLGVKKSQLEMLRALELKDEFYAPLIKRCQEKNIMFLSTPHGSKASVDFLETLNLAAYKVGSADLTNYILLDRLSKIQKPIILSTGMTTMRQVAEAITYLQNKGADQIIALHCTTNYPCPLNEVNLNVMTAMMKTLNVPIGYSDHTQTHETAILATKLGQALYECHFTLDKSLPGPDHAASATPAELTTRIKLIRRQIILGQKEKKPTLSELKMIPCVSKSIVATRNLKKGQLIKAEDLEAKRPGSGLSPTLWETLIGKKLTKNVKTDQQLQLTDFE